MKKFLSALILLSSFNVMAAEPQEGTDFNRTLHVIPTGMPDKIVVTEIFSYGNTLSYRMDPLVTAWAKKLPVDVVFKRVPFAMGEHALLAEVYYILEEMNLVDKLHRPFFEALHKEHLFGPSHYDLALYWLAKRTGLNQATLLHNSQMGLRLSKYQASTEFYRNAGAAPALVIDGQFLLTGNNEKDLKVADYLIANIRADKAQSTKN